MMQRFVLILAGGRGERFWPWSRPDRPKQLLPLASGDETAFAADLGRGFDHAERERVLITFGIRPTGPETNFGYMQRGAKLADRVHRVARFTEKPDRARAAEWAAGGEYFWNSGVFVWRRGVFFDA